MICNMSPFVCVKYTYTLKIKLDVHKNANSDYILLVK